MGCARPRALRGDPPANARGYRALCALPTTTKTGVRGIHVGNLPAVGKELRCRSRLSQDSDRDAPPCSRLTGRQGRRQTRRTAVPDHGARTVQRTANGPVPGPSSASHAAWTRTLQQQDRTNLNSTKRTWTASESSDYLRQHQCLLATTSELSTTLAHLRRCSRSPATSTPRHSRRCWIR